jgi:hypothetical protein
MPVCTSRAQRTASTTLRKLNDDSIARALDDTAVMSGDGGINEVAAEAPYARKSPILVRACGPAISDDVRDKNRRKLSGLAHFGVPLAEA